MKKVTPRLDVFEASPFPDSITLVFDDGLRTLNEIGRSAAIAGISSGAVTAVRFDAVVFRARYPNRNFLRFYDYDLEGFAGSFAGKPFLLDHDTDSVASRIGTVVESALVGLDVVQRIEVTTTDGMLAVVRGIIDRFSIGWFFDGVVCGICGEDWFSCEHWPGHSYDGLVCELYFVNPVGKEASAVNVPAVSGTAILADGAIPVRSEVRQMSDDAVVPEEVQELEERLARVEALLAERAAADAVAGAPAVDAGAVHVVDRLEEFQGAVDWIFGASDELPDPYLRRADNLYVALTGDRAWRGVFQRDFALASADSTTLAGMVVNAMNKVMVQHWAALAHYRWYEQVVSVIGNDGSVHDMQFISFGGIGDLPTVAEGAAYTELSVDDQKETASFLKKGGYVGITLEMIRNSEIAKMQLVPRALAAAAVRTRSAAAAAIFTSNSGVGPTMSDGKALFHADHGNLLSTAFGTSGWAEARQAMMKQAELNSGKRLGLLPAFWLGPAELYDDALRQFGYGAGPGGRLGDGSSDDVDVNIYGVSRPGDPRPIPIAVPEFTDASNWAFLADPKVYPTIMMSYAGGGTRHKPPELFSVTSETSGLVFTNDVLPVKVRDWWSIGVADWRGIGKSNVA